MPGRDLLRDIRKYGKRCHAPLIHVDQRQYCTTLSFIDVRHRYMRQQYILCPRPKTISIPHLTDLFQHPIWPRNKNCDSLADSHCNAETMYVSIEKRLPFTRPAEDEVPESANINSSRRSKKLEMDIE